MISFLQIVRQECGLTQTGLGKRVGVSSSAICAIEHCKRPSWPILRKRIVKAMAERGVEVREQLLFLSSGWARPINEVRGLDEQQVTAK